MNRHSLRLMATFRDKYLGGMTDVSVLDVGASAAYDSRRRSYRMVFAPPRFDYHGMDVEPGPNVDIVGYEDLEPRGYDILVSGQTMEHVRRPWEWLKNLTRYFRQYICIIAPHTWEEHRCPIDTYRYFPDGMRDLFAYAKIRPIEIYKTDGGLTVGIGQ